MATPASTKQNAHHNPGLVIRAFSSPVQAPDIRLNVLGINEFHTHSFLLKHHSAFFRTFLDSPDKQHGDKLRNPEEITDVERRAGKVTGFRYEWVTQIDTDGKGWHLVAASNVQSGPPSPYNLTQRLFQAELFHKLLCAIYNRPFDIFALTQLISLVEMADYYRMLPALSSTLDGVLHRSAKNIAREFDGEALQVLPAAAKVRNELLFRETLIFLLGPYDNPRYTKLDDPKLLKIAELAHTKLWAKIGRTQKDLWDRATVDHQQLDHKVQFLNTCAKIASFPEGGGMQFPAYYRRLVDTHPQHPFRDDVVGIMHSDLKLAQNMYAGDLQAGVGEYKRYFFCDLLDKKDLPWNPEETDW
ncbi:hypothetical protein LARI1_G001972 [Lachnellula arida]|uniref:BTB domain-containing protein n=1 Tax=Lachnellula arida TaxID=1316785 RepID=A0A8T9BMD3_9HELO|nr:hypothetical protein LARI1_G001972 [Lachnellula arida]